MHMQDLWRRGQPPCQLDGGFVEKDETRGVVVVGRSMLAINFRAIVEFIAANKKNLDPG
jgi:hypothetical protein